MHGQVGQGAVFLFLCVLVFFVTLMENTKVRGDSTLLLSLPYTKPAHSVAHTAYSWPCTNQVKAT